MEKFFILLLLGYLNKTTESIKKEESATSQMTQPGINIDFENGTIEPWYDCSEVGTRWIIQNNSSPTNEMRTFQQSPPAPPNNGRYFLLLKHELNGFGIGQLNSPTFLAHPGDRIAFSYWL